MEAARQSEAKVRSWNSHSLLPTLYYHAVPKNDQRLQAVLERPDLAKLQKRLEVQGESLSRDHCQIYHLDGFTSILFPVVTPLSRPTAKFAIYRLHRYGGGPQALLLEIHGAMGPKMTLNSTCLNSLTISSASGNNRITLRPEAQLCGGRQTVQVFELDIEEEDEDDGFWSAIGDFFEGIADAIVDGFSKLWEWIEEVAGDLWEEIKNGLAQVFPIDRDENGVPDGVLVQKTIRF